MSTEQDLIRSMISGFYDFQKLRIAAGNRIAAQFKAKLGQNPSQPEEEGITDEEDQNLLKTLRTEYRKLMDGVKQVRLATFKATPVISTFTEFILLQQYLDLEEMEKHHAPQIEKRLVMFPIYEAFLNTIKGCGPLMSGVILCEIDITKARYPSSLWQYAGLGVGSDGTGMSRRKEHLVQRPYTDKDGTPAVRASIVYNPWLKTKLMGVLAPCLLKAANPVYRPIYDQYKHRTTTDPAKAEWSKGHHHQAAMRYMIKRFLVDLYKAWRPLEGLPVAPEYHEAKHGHQHSS